MEKQITKTYKDIGKEFKLSISGRRENAKITYTSSNKKVATAKDGKLLIKGEGKATITVNFAGTKNYNAAKKEIEVIVLRQQTIQIGAGFKPEIGIAGATIGTMNEIRYTNGKILLNATAEGNKLTYTSSDKKIAVVNKDGEIQCKSTGIVAITIIAKQTDEYEKTTERVVFKIIKGKPNIICSNEIDKKVSDAPFNLGANTGVEKVTLSYKSSSPEIATVDNGGNVTLHNWSDAVLKKDVQITIVSKATKNYESTTAAITLRIYKFPPDEIYLKQPKDSVTCTLYAAMMMLRRKAWLNNKDWEGITEQEVKPIAWNEGLNWHFTYGGMTTWRESLPEGVTEKKQKLISMLEEHPEGIVIYNWNIPHAVLLTDYTDGVFYSADPDSNPNRAKGRIPLSETLIAESCNTTDQDLIINSLGSYWYIK